MDPFGSPGPPAFPPPSLPPPILEPHLHPREKLPGRRRGADPHGPTESPLRHHHWDSQATSSRCLGEYNPIAAPSLNSARRDYPLSIAHHTPIGSRTTHSEHPLRLLSEVCSISAPLSDSAALPQRTCRALVSSLPIGLAWAGLIQPEDGRP